MKTATQKMGGLCITPPYSQEESQEKSVTFRCDYLSGFGSCNDIEELAQFLCDHYAIEGFTRKMGAHEFTHQVKTVHEGVNILFYHSEPGYSDMVWQFRVELSGQWFERVSFKDSLRYFNGLKHRYNFRPTRIDLALDDYQKKLSIPMLKRSFDEGLGCYFRTSSYYNEVKMKGKIKNESHGIYFGKGRKMLRVYETINKHDYDAIRLELQLREEWATATWNTMFEGLECHKTIEESCDQVMRDLMQYVLGSIDFKLKDDKNLDRCERCLWWQEFIDYVAVNPSRYKGVKVSSCVRKTLDWVYRQVGKTLAMMKKSLGAVDFSLYLSAIIEKSRERFDDIDIIKELKMTEYFKCSNI